MGFDFCIVIIYEITVLKASEKLSDHLGYVFYLEGFQRKSFEDIPAGAFKFLTILLPKMHRIEEDVRKL